MEGDEPANLSFELQKPVALGKRDANEQALSLESLELAKPGQASQRWSNRPEHSFFKQHDGEMEYQLMRDTYLTANVEELPQGDSIHVQIEVKSANLASSYKRELTVSQNTQEMSMYENQHEERRDKSVSIVQTRMMDGKLKYSIVDTTNDHLGGKRTERMCYESTQTLLSDINLLCNEDLLILETGQVEKGPAGPIVSISLNMITKQRNTMQRLMVFKCPLPENGAGQPVRLFLSNGKKALAILKAQNKLSVLTGLGEPEYSTKLSKNYLEVPMCPTPIWDMTIVEKQYEAPLNPGFVYIGTIHKDWKFSEVIVDKTSKLVVKKLDVRFDSLPTVAGGKFIGIHYSPFMKRSQSPADRCRVTLFVDQGETVTINVAICDRRVHTGDAAPSPSKLVFQGQFVVDKRKYGLEGLVKLSYHEDPYNQLKLFLVGERLEALVCVDINFREKDAQVCTQKIQIAGPGIQTAHKADGIQTVHKVDWVEPSCLQMVGGMMTLLCNDRQTAIHIRRVNGPACLKDIIPPRQTHLDRLLTDESP